VLSALDTKIKLLDGRDITLQQMIDEYNSGKINWVYSCHPTTGNIVPGKVTWAGITRKNTNVMKLTFDNNESVIVTPDHKFPIKDVGFVEAKDLQIGQSMIPLYTKKQKLFFYENSCTIVYNIYFK
jgi:DNA gyrase subunit B